MNFLINASNIKIGGGIQVTQSICDQLRNIPEHHYVIVLSTYIDDVNIQYGNNCDVVRYNVRNSLATLLRGRDGFLDRLVVEKGINAVLTVFGPSRWVPKVPHLCGFARAQLVLKDSPYNKHKTFSDIVWYKVWEWFFKKSSKVFYTENAYISRMLPDLLGDIKVYTVTNYYHQVYDQPKIWKRTVKLPEFDGITCITVSSYMPHKNLEIIPEIVRCFNKKYSNLDIRFVLTFNEDDMKVGEDVKENVLFVGKVDVSECPNLYEQADIMFMPTLMECFTATYPEAMRMGIPIVTTDLEFARGLCGNAASYYSAIDPESAVEAIYKIFTDKTYASLLIENGKKQLRKYDNYEQRAEKLVKLLEKISKQE